jgi:hypothetical protein
MIQPSTSLRVPQQASPCFNFLVDAGSWRCSSSKVPSSQRTSSNVCSRVRRTLESCCLSRPLCHCDKVVDEYIDLFEWKLPGTAVVRLRPWGHGC